MEGGQSMVTKAVDVSGGGAMQWLHQTTQRNRLGNHRIVNRLAKQGEAEG